MLSNLFCFKLICHFVFSNMMIRTAAFLGLLYNEKGLEEKKMLEPWSINFCLLTFSMKFSWTGNFDICVYIFFFVNAKSFWEFDMVIRMKRETTWEQNPSLKTDGWLNTAIIFVGTWRNKKKLVLTPFSEHQEAAWEKKMFIFQSLYC